MKLAFWETRRYNGTRLRPGPILLARLELHLARGMHFDIAPLDLQVGPLGSREDFLFGAGVEAAVGAGESHLLVGGRGGSAALALQADLAAGGMQVDAGFGVRFLWVAGLANGKQRDAVFHRQAVVALGDQVAVLVAGDAEVFSGGQNMTFRGELGDAGRRAVLEAWFAPGRRGAGAALDGFDAAVTGGRAAFAGCGTEYRNRVFEGVHRRQLVGFWIAFESGILLGGDLAQALAEALGLLGLANRFTTVELAAAGVGAGIGTDQQAIAGAECR